MAVNKPPSPLAWQQAGLRYHRLSYFLRQTFGCRVGKLTLDAGLDCPNRDGTLALGGCLFCDPASFSPSRRRAAGSIPQQIADGLAQAIRSRRAPDRFLSYLQPATNTYAPVEILEPIFRQALGHPAICGLIVGTRPDCVPDCVLDLLADLARQTWVVVELGLQTMHQRSLEWLRRGHGLDAFLDAVARCHRRGLRVGVHVILGIPGESVDDMGATAELLASLGVHSVKIHNLYAAKGTPLAAAVTRGEVVLPTRDEHVIRVAAFLQRLHPECVIDRLLGDAPPEYLVGPGWVTDKTAFLRALDAYLLANDIRQGTLSPST